MGHRMMELVVTRKGSLLALVLLLLVAGESEGDAPGDESCSTQGEQQVNIRVLMDSWRYRTLLSGNGSSSGGVWTSSDHWISAGACSSSLVWLCPDSKGKKWLQTQFISKSLPAPDTYPVTIFVEITIVTGTCSGPDCNDNFELQVSHVISGEPKKYSGNGIRPDRYIPLNFSRTKRFSFDSQTNSSGFHIRLEADNACVTVSRVLVYRYECPGHDRLPTGLARRPATQAPSTGFVLATPYCAENSHFSDISIENTMTCQYNGTWRNDQSHCVCDEGYNNDKTADVCEDREENNPPISTLTVPPATPTDSSSSEEPTPSPSPSTSTTDLLPTSNSTTDPLPTSDPSDRPDIAVDTSESGNSRTTPPVYVLAGVCGVIVIIVTLIAVVVCLIIALVRKSKKSSSAQVESNDKQLSNPVYDAMAENIDIKFTASNTSNGSRTARNQQDEQTMREFVNPLYHTGQRSVHTNRMTEHHRTSGNENAYFEEPQYSIPNGNDAMHVEYETPVVTPPTSISPSPPPPPPPTAHVYDYASVPPDVAHQYATLEPPVHAYHTLECPTEGSGGLSAVSAEDTSRRDQERGSTGQKTHSLEGDEHVYSVIEPK